MDSSSPRSPRQNLKILPQEVIFDNVAAKKNYNRSVRVTNTLPTEIRCECKVPSERYTASPDEFSLAPGETITVKLRLHLTRPLAPRPQGYQDNLFIQSDYFSQRFQSVFYAEGRSRSVSPAGTPRWLENAAHPNSSDVLGSAQRSSSLSPLRQAMSSAAAATIGISGGTGPIISPKKNRHISPPLFASRRSNNNSISPRSGMTPRCVEYENELLETLRERIRGLENENKRLSRDEKIARTLEEEQRRWFDERRLLTEESTKRN